MGLPLAFNRMNILSEIADILDKSWEDEDERAEDQ